jgi:hypothetical protein
MAAAKVLRASDGRVAATTVVTDLPGDRSLVTSRAAYVADVAAATASSPNHGAGRWRSPITEREVSELDRRKRVGEPAGRWRASSTLLCGIDPMRRA